LASLADELKTAMVERLRADQGFSARVEGRIFAAEPKDLLAAWVGATGFDAGDGLVDLLATVHVRVRTGTEAANALIEIARAVFAEPPAVGGISITSWRPDYREARLEEEHTAYHGLARFRANAQVIPPPV
jgi:hypothetical protein